jgi:hypothetical protein
MVLRISTLFLLSILAGAAERPWQQITMARVAEMARNFANPPADTGLQCGGGGMAI